MRHFGPLPSHGPGMLDVVGSTRPRPEFVAASPTASCDDGHGDRWHDGRRIPFVRLVVPLLILAALALPAVLLAAPGDDEPEPPRRRRRW